jgi:hypothetical protein
MKKLAVLFILIIVFTSCTQNQRAKNFGGKASIVLPAGKKLINTTWKNDNLWYLVRDRRPEEKIEEYEFYEESSFGILEGTYIIKEQ